MWYIIDKTNEEVTTMRKELLKGLSEEQIKKVEACKNSEEILALAKAEGIELNDEQLEAVSGGSCDGQKKKVCPKCNSTNITKYNEDLEDGRMRYDYVCQDCLHRWFTRGTDF